MFVIPLPTYLVDFTIALNIGTGDIRCFIEVVLYWQNPQFSTFPALLVHRALSSGIIDRYQPSYLD